MIHAHENSIDASTTRITFADGEDSLSYRQVFDGLRSAQEFGEVITETLSRSPFVGFFWEVHPVTEATQDDPFECVLVEGKMLTQLRADDSAFSQHFAILDEDQSVATFPNLGGDAMLVVPAPRGDSLEIYAHMASFLRNAPRDQICEFWSAVGAAALERLSPEPFWLSTAGLGVSWLHLRLDSRPKYYRHIPYKSASA